MCATALSVILYSPKKHFSCPVCRLTVVLLTIKWVECRSKESNVLELPALSGNEAGMECSRSSAPEGPDFAVTECTSVSLLAVNIVLFVAL